jgi:YHS domain-containing protein
MKSTMYTHQKNIFKSRTQLLLLLIAAMVTGSTFAQTAAKRKADYNLEKNLAIQGYDPVAYFTQKKAVLGKSTIAAAYEGVTYYFSTQATKELFIQNPTKFEPQYGGWCSYAMGATGEKVEIDPETFKIVDGKLYLFYNAYFNNTLKSWNKDEAQLKAKADTNWKKIIK